MLITFPNKGGFCQGSDTIIKMIDNKLFVVDSSSNSLYIFDRKNNSWVSNSLNSYKIP